MATMSTDASKRLRRGDAAVFGLFMHENFHMYLTQTKSTQWWADARKAVASVRLSTGGKAKTYHQQATLAHEMIAGYAGRVSSAYFQAQRDVLYHYRSGHLHKRSPGMAVTNYQSTKARYDAAIRHAQVAPVGYTTSSPRSKAQDAIALDRLPTVLQQETNEDLFGQTRVPSFSELVVKTTGDWKAPRAK